MHEFRPLYAPQLLRDRDSPLIFSYDVFTQNNDNGTVEPMIGRMVDQVGRKPKELFVDSGYVSVRHLEFCAVQGITVYGQRQETPEQSRHRTSQERLSLA